MVDRLSAHCFCKNLAFILITYCIYALHLLKGLRNCRKPLGSVFCDKADFFHLFVQVSEGPIRGVKTERRENLKKFSITKRGGVFGLPGDKHPTRRFACVECLFASELCF